MKCLCGCLEETNPGNKYIWGHNPTSSKGPKSPSHRRKISRTLQGIEILGETRERMSIGQQLREHQPFSLIHCIRIGAAEIGNQKALGNKSRLNKPHLEATKEKCREGNLKYWSDPDKRSERAKLAIKTQNHKITLPETILENIIRDYSLPYTYNGNNGNNN